MARFISRVCKNEACESHRIVPSTGENARALCEVVGGNKDDYSLKCGTCGLVFDDAKPTQRPKYTYPHYNSSAGVTFDSYSSQRSWEKKTGSEPM